MEITLRWQDSLLNMAQALIIRIRFFDNHFLFSNLLIMLHFCIPPQNGYSSLQVACDRGNTDIVKLLIQSNANIELKNKVGLNLFSQNNYYTLL